MKIKRKILVMSSMTDNKEVHRYMCDSCGERVKDITMEGKKGLGRCRVSYLIYLKECSKCK